MVTCLGELPVQKVGMGRGMCADQFPTGSCWALRVKASRKAGGVPENICLTTKPRGECFFLITSSKRCKAKALASAFVITPPLPSALPYLVPFSVAGEPTVRAGHSRIFTCCCKWGWSRAVYVTDLHMSDPLSLQSLSTPPASNLPVNC